MNVTLLIGVLSLFYANTLIVSGLFMALYRRSNPNAPAQLSDCFCDYCQIPIRPKILANLPIINVLVMGGKTNCCNRSIWHYLQIEAGGGAALTLVMLAVMGLIA